MANREHLAILKRAVEAWNAWRDENPEISPDLKNAQFRGADLKRANLTGANLVSRGGANIKAAILVAANLREV